MPPAARPGAPTRLRLVEEGQGQGTPDRELLAGLKSGDDDLAVEFHDRFRPRVSRTILRLLRSREEHEDLVQQSMIELVLSIDAFRWQCSLDSWVATVTAHVVFKHLRSRKRERQVFTSLDEEGDDVLDLAPGDRGDRVEGRSTLSRVRHHLEQMDSGRATVFVLHEVHGYDLRETAEILGISISNAQTRLVRGRKELHERIRGDDSLADALRSRRTP